MTFRFLIDECLSPELVQLAVAAGHLESTCVVSMQSSPSMLGLCA